jgi:hypothetical protein
LMAVALLIVMLVGFFQILRALVRWPVALAQALALTMTFITPMFAFHAFYLHSNIVATVYLFIGLYGGWWYLRTHERAWLILTLLAITSFSFTRIEGVLYSLIFFVLLLVLQRPDRLNTWLIVGPYSLLAFSWYALLYLSVDQTGLLSQSNILIVIGSLVGLIAFGVLNQWPPFVRWRPFVPPFMLVGLGLGLLLAFALKPEHMATSSWNMLLNLLSVADWGWSWLLITLLLLFVASNDGAYPERRLLLYGAVIYMLLVVLLGFSRIPYRNDPFDSANRLMLHIQPVLLLYIALKAEQLYTWIWPAYQREAVRELA